jgi:hypothetical protein
VAAQFEMGEGFARKSTKLGLLVYLKLELVAGLLEAARLRDSLRSFEEFLGDFGFGMVSC